MTDHQAKERALDSVGRMKIICEAEYPPGSVRQLIWFAKGADHDMVHYMTTPVICGSDLVNKALRIENSPGFFAWGVNPWTGEKAEFRII